MQPCEEARYPAEAEGVEAEPAQEVVLQGSADLEEMEASAEDGDASLLDDSVGSSAAASHPTEAAPALPEANDSSDKTDDRLTMDQLLASAASPKHEDLLKLWDAIEIADSPCASQTIQEDATTSTASTTSAADTLKALTERLEKAQAKLNSMDAGSTGLNLSVMFSIS